MMVVWTYSRSTPEKASKAVIPGMPTSEMTTSKAVRGRMHYAQDREEFEPIADLHDGMAIFALLELEQHRVASR